MKRWNKPVKNKIWARVLLLIGLYGLSIQEAYCTIKRADDLPLSETIEGLMTFIAFFVLASSMLVFSFIDDSLDKREKRNNRGTVN